MTHEAVSTMSDDLGCHVIPSLYIFSPPGQKKKKSHKLFNYILPKNTINPLCFNLINCVNIGEK